jgi:two-component system, sensor histidine kinase YesM
MFRPRPAQGPPALQRKTVYRRIVLLFTVVVIGLYVISIFIYNASVRSLRASMTEPVTLMEKAYLEQMERTIFKVKEMIFSCVLKQDWSLLLTERGPLHTYATLRLVLGAQERLSAIRNATAFLSDVRAHIAPWGRTISAEEGLMDLDRAEKERIIMPRDARGAQFIRRDDRLYLTSAYRLPTEEPLSIVAELDNDELASSIAGLSASAAGASILMETGTGAVVAQAGNAGILGNGALRDFIAEAVKTSDTAERRAGAHVSGTRGGGQALTVAWTSSAYLGFSLVHVLPTTELYGPLSRFSLMIWLFTGAVLASVLVFVTLSYRAVGRPMGALVAAFQRLETGDFSVRLRGDRRDDFAHLYHSFDHMAENLQRLVDEVYNKENLVRKADLRQLQAQINPHFLYNSFYMLHRMIKLGDTENAERFSLYLGRYFRFITHNEADRAPLSAEVEHARAYAQIMQMRLGEAVAVEFGEVPAHFAQMPVPRVILQPLLENAFGHGIRELRDGGRVRVAFEEEGNALLIRVEDNGRGIPGPVLSRLKAVLDGTLLPEEVTGIVNIHRRMRIVFGELYSMDIQSGENAGTRILLTVPSGVA